MGPSRLVRIFAAVLLTSLLQGCASHGLDSIPGNALLMQESGSVFTFTATDKGMVYLRDQPADQIVYQGPMSVGERLDVDAKAQRVTVAGRAVRTSPLRTDATYQVFFLASERHEYHPMMNP